MIDPDFNPPFDVREPARLASPLVFNSPHSGCRYPARFLAASRLGPQALRRSEDAHVDRLLADVTLAGAPLMRAHFPRAFLDVNREPYELDPRMFDGRLPPFANTRSLRVAGGLGTIARIVGESQEIYARRIPVSEALARVEALYKPYHHELRRLLRRAHSRFGVALLVDCHSMPSAAAGGQERGLADVVVGDRYGASCADAIVAATERFLAGRGYACARNKPYAGGYITEHYGDPAAGFHAVQIEIGRALYMNEATFAPTAGFSRLAGDFADLASGLTEFVLGFGASLPAAAE